MGLDKPSYITFDSEWEMEGFVASAMEEIAKKYDATIETNYSDHAFSIECDERHQEAMALEIDELFKGFGACQV